MPCFIGRFRLNGLNVSQSGIWDPILADPQRFQFLLFVCLAILLALRDVLLANEEFSENLVVLQVLLVVQLASQLTASLEVLSDITDKFQLKSEDRIF